MASSATAVGGRGKEMEIESDREEEASIHARQSERGDSEGDR